jgi:hypothetical protein
MDAGVGLYLLEYILSKVENILLVALEQYDASLGE